MIANFVKRLGIDLTDAFACHAEFLPNLFECMSNHIFKPEANLQDFLLARCEFTPID